MHFRNFLIYLHVDFHYSENWICFTQIDLSLTQLYKMDTIQIWEYISKKFETVLTFTEYYLNRL